MNDEIREQIKARLAGPLLNPNHLNRWVLERSGYAPEPERQVLTLRRGRSYRPRLSKR